jgi:hypothetical protein
MAAKTKWMPPAAKKPGAVRAQLRIPKDQKMPATPGKAAAPRARLAEAFAKPR